MTDSSNSGWNDPKNRDLRERRSAKLAIISKERKRESQLLLDDLKLFGLYYSNLHELVDEPKNTFAVAIGRMVDFLEIFDDEVNLSMLAMILNRPEGKGLVTKPIIKWFGKFNSLDSKFQAARAIRTTAEKDDTEAIAGLVLSTNVHISCRTELIAAIARLDRKRAVDLWIECLGLDDETTMEAIKKLAAVSTDEIKSEVRKFCNHSNPMIRNLAREF